ARDQFPEHGGAAAGCDGNRVFERPRRPQAPSAARLHSRLRRQRAAVFAVEPSIGHFGAAWAAWPRGGDRALWRNAARHHGGSGAASSALHSGVGYNITFGVIGGFTPLAATWLVDRTGDEIAPAFLIMAAAAVTFLTLLRFRETYRRPFIGAGSRAATAYA